MLNQTLPSKENNYVLFTLYYTVLLLDYNSCLNPPNIMSLFLKYSLNLKVSLYVLNMWLPHQTLSNVGWGLLEINEIKLHFTI